MRVSLLTIGDELLLGQVADTNATHIGSYLAESGINLVKHITVGDVPAALMAALAYAAQDVHAVLLTGGLGPTSDDVTLEVLAQYVGVDLEFNERTYQRIEHIFRDIIKRPIHPSLRRQAMQPAGASTLLNAQGTAPGVVVEHGGQLLIAMPGVPREMKYLLSAEVVPLLLERFAAAPATRVTIHTAGWGESQIEDALQPVLRSLPPHFSIAYLPSLGTVRLRLTGFGESKTSLEEVKLRLVDCLPPALIVGYEDKSLLPVVHQLLIERQATLALAESCTGGALGHLIVEQMGASAYYLGGIIAYDNGVKEQQLGVNPQLIDQYGAVSEQVVRAMVAGALKSFGSTYALATSGIAGPTGGSPNKPVGTIWIAAGDSTTIIARRLSLGRDRASNIEYTAVATVDLLRRLILFGETRL